MKVSLRGGLGYQLLCYIAALAQSIEHSDPIESITLHMGKYDNPLYKDQIVAVDYLSKILNLDFPVYMNYDEIKKFPFFKEENIKLVIKHLDEIRARVKIKENDVEPAEGFILHVRQHDRPVVDVSYYERIYLTVPIGKVIGDDGKFNRFFPMAEFSTHPDDAIEDWFCLYKSKYVIGAFSSFTLSAALLNPELKLAVIPPIFWTPGTVSAMDQICTEMLVQNIKNIGWY